MSWYPIAFLPPQYENSSGVPYSGAVLKAYAAGTTTNIPMATGYDGATTSASLALNANGYPVYSGAVVIPHIQEDYKLALYPTQTAADANSGAVWTVDNIKIADTTNTPFYQAFDGDGVTSVFTLSQSLGTDEQTLMVFADRALPEYVQNGTFTTDTVWTKGTGWTIGAGVATATGAISTDLSQNASAPRLLQGQSYTLTYTVTASAGSVTGKIGGTSGTARSSSGTYTETIVAGSTQAIVFSGSGFTGTIDNVSIKPTYGALRQILRTDEYTLSGNQLTLGEVPPQGTKNVIVFAPSLLLGAAALSAAAAATSEANALTYANSASNSATAAALSSAAAQSVYGTSATENTIGTGSKTFTTQTGKSFAPNMYVTITDQATTANYFYGSVTSYNSTTGSLVVDVTATGGSGTISSWNIALAGMNGAFVGVASGTDTLTASIPGVSTLADGLVVFVRAAAANATTTPTLNVSGTGAHTITKLGGAALAVGELYGALYECVFKYNLANTRWEFLNPAPVILSPKDNPSFTTAVSLSGTDVKYSVSDVSGTTVTGVLGADTTTAYAGSSTNHPFVLSTNDTERGRISAAGALLWNTTAQLGTAQISLLCPNTNGVAVRNSNAAAGKYWRWDVDSNNSCIMYNNGGSGCFITDGATSWSSSSDERLKTNIVTLENALEKVLAIRGVSYRYTADSEDVVRVGVIAQEVQKVLPCAVMNAPFILGDDTQYLGVQYTDLIPLLINAVKELSSQLDALKLQVTG